MQLTQRKRKDTTVRSEEKVESTLPAGQNNFSRTQSRFDFYY